jgi:hypothetical protein
MKHLLLLGLGLALALTFAAAPSVALAQPEAAVCKRKKKKRRRKPKSPRTAPAAPTSAPAATTSPTPTLRRSNRMEFDARVVKGEKASGAVYLFRRVPRRLPPLLQLKRDPLDRIVRPVLHRGVDPIKP